MNFCHKMINVDDKGKEECNIFLKDYKNTEKIYCQ